MTGQEAPGALVQARAKLAAILTGKDLLEVPITVRARPLSAEEAIGNPDRRDYPIITGKERVIEASVLQARGHAFTDSPRDFTGSLADVLDLPLSTNQERAIFVATLNAVLAHLGTARGTLHCRDEDPERCAQAIAERLIREHGRAPVGLIGLNPAIAEQLVKSCGADFVRITDLNAENIGKQRFGVEIRDGRTATEELIAASTVTILTGTTLVNGTFDAIQTAIARHRKICWVYGVTAAGVCSLLGIERICPYGRDG